MQQCITVSTDAVYMKYSSDMLHKQESILRAKVCRFRNIFGLLKGSFSSFPSLGYRQVGNIFLPF